MIIKIVVGIIICLFLLFIYCCCRVASEADQYMEEYKNEKMYKAFIYLNDENPLTMIVGGSNRSLIIDKLTDFYRKISGAAEIEVKLKEVVYINGDYRYK